MLSNRGLLGLIAGIEFFERFGFYSVQGVLILYLLKIQGFQSVEAYHIFGAFSALLYGFVGLGGLLGDKVFGPKKTMFLGLLVMLFGYLGLTVLTKAFFFPALALVCLGNALFKANPAALIGHMYQGDTTKLHAAFTLFYMAVNIGALFALIVGPQLSAYFDYSYAFGTSAFGIFLALILVYIKRRELNISFHMNHQYQSMSWSKWTLTLAVFLLAWGLISYLLHAYNWVILGLKILIIGILIFYIRSAMAEEGVIRRRMLVVLILMFEAVCFFTLYHQMPTSRNMYAILHVYPELLGLHFDPQSFQALNPFWIIVWSPILARMYQKHTWSIYVKFATGMLFCGVSYFILYVSHFFVDASSHISGWWMVLSTIFQSLAELLVSALGLAMVAELVPQSKMGTVMGMWFLTSAVSGITGAYVASLSAVPQAASSEVSLQAFANLFLGIGVATIVFSVLMFASTRFLEKITRD
jgi:proton-dependent oligopeptide transporter, POT family